MSLSPLTSDLNCTCYTRQRSIDVLILCTEVTPQKWLNWHSNLSKRLSFCQCLVSGRTNLKRSFSFQLPFREHHKKLEIRVSVTDNIHYLHHNIKYLCCNTVSCKVAHQWEFVLVLYAVRLGGICKVTFFFNDAILTTLLLLVCA